jgi:hypothetical protein
MDLKTDNVITWLELRALEHGTDNQMERWLAKMLPEDELTALARNEIFAGFVPFTRWKNITELDADNDIRHEPDCGVAFNVPGIDFRTVHATKLDHDQWETWKRLADVMKTIQTTHSWCVNADTVLSAEPRIHIATCKCKRQALYHTALVTVAWAGRVLTREYKL